MVMIVVPLVDTQCFSHYTLIVDAWYSLSFVEGSVIVGPTIVHIVVLGFTSSLMGLINAIHFAARTFQRLSISVYRQPSRLLDFPLDCVRLALTATLSSLPMAFVCLSYEYSVHPHIKAILWRYPFLCRRWRNAVRRVYWILVWRYRDCISIHIKMWGYFIPDLLAATRVVFDFCLETWFVLGGLQKLAIVVPAAAYYGYFYIIPAVRRLFEVPVLIRKWRRKWRRR
ncbi:hypothetical protein C8R44DRAFT_171068 [Mycena epipterygia]|nr:hypothetical protein C8R44DRAFT_171068 [Mycena epipterygia]